jgi:protein-tyrosine phosphatase
MTTAIGTSGERAPAMKGGGLPALRWAKSGARRLLEALERRRAEAVRRHPAALTRSLQAARSILVLCAGNVSRSVFAAHLLSRVPGPVRIASAGLTTQPGWCAHPRVVIRARELHIDLSRHASVAVTPAMLRAADLVLVMDVGQLAEVTRRCPRARRKTFLLTSLAPDVPLEIPDPAGTDDATVDACLEHVTRAVRPLLEALSSGRGVTA